MPHLSDGDEQYTESPAWLRQLENRRNVFSPETRERLKGLTHRIAYVCFTCLYKSPNGTTDDKHDVIRHSVNLHGLVTVIAELSFIKPSDEISFINAPRYMCACCDMPFMRIIDVPTHTCPLFHKKTSKVKSS